jgi:hypothetical protein
VYAPTLIANAEFHENVFEVSVMKDGFEPAGDIGMLMEYVKVVSVQVESATVNSENV